MTVMYVRSMFDPVASYYIDLQYEDQPTSATTWRQYMYSQGSIEVSTEMESDLP